MLEQTRKGNSSWKHKSSQERSPESHQNSLFHCTQWWVTLVQDWQ